MATMLVPHFKNVDFARAGETHGFAAVHHPMATQNNTLERTNRAGFAA